MHKLGRGLCLGSMLLCVVACTQDKKLPVGERISVLESNAYDLSAAQKKISSLPVPHVNGDWAQAGVNSQHIVGNLKAGFTLKEKWAMNFGKGINKRDIILAAPVVYNDTVFVMDTQGKVSAFGMSDGKLLWENLLSAEVGGFKEAKNRASGLAVDRNTLFATTGFGGVFAIDTNTGKPKWRKILESPIRIAPTVTDNMLLIQTVDNHIYALNKYNGQELWTFAVAHEDTVMVGGASPAYDKEDNVVIAGFSNGEIVVLNATVGTPLWSSMLISRDKAKSTTEINTIGSYPIVENGLIYAISNTDYLAALDMRTGDKMWEKEIGSMQNMLSVGSHLFVISNKNILYAVNKDSGEITWATDIKEYFDEEERNANVYAGAPIMINSSILLAFSNGKILKIDASSGLVKAKTNLGMDISNGIIAVKESVVAVSDKAEVIVFD